MRHINQNGLNLIKSFEGLRLDAYVCPAGKLTIGYGHVILKDESYKKITEEQAEKILKQDLLFFESGVEEMTRGILLNNNQFSALICFAFNVGLRNLRSSTLMRLLLAKSFDSVPDQFLRWNKAAGKELPGLTRRRMAERALFMTPDFSGSV